MVDLHTHSTASDGSDAPRRIPELAADAGCRAVALTDHDCLDGVVEAAARAAEVGIELVPGCEISCQVDRGAMHMLVHFVEPGEGPLQDELLRLQLVRRDRNHRLVERLQAVGIPVTLEEITAEAGGNVVGRPHAAAVLVRKGYADSIEDAFRRWLARGCPGYVEKERLEPARALELAHGSGGVCTLAHPLSLDLEPADLAARVRQLAGMGLDGLEAEYARYSPEDRAGLAGLARAAGLVVTGGSDHHGTYKPDLRIGVGRGDLAVPDEALEQLEARRP